MGTLNHALGFDLTDRAPLTVSPFNADESEDSTNPPPGTFRMITETGIFMITEVGANFMITE